MASSPDSKPPVPLLSGGNPQIPKGYGDAPVQAYIAAMPGWKRDIGRRLDAIVEAEVPHGSELGLTRFRDCGLADSMGASLIRSTPCPSPSLKGSRNRG
jgi:hypothetical protein